MKPIHGHNDKTKRVTVTITKEIKDNVLVIKHRDGGYESFDFESE